MKGGVEAPGVTGKGRGSVWVRLLKDMQSFRWAEKGGGRI